MDVDVDVDVDGGSGPIGVFDSGLGGLSVVRELRLVLPNRPLVYYADSAFCPYGEREPAVILARSCAIADGLVATGARLLVVACNTASAVALEALRERHPALPIVGLVPALKPAVAASRSGRVAVLATPRTVAGGLLARVIERHAAACEVVAVPAPGLADLVEAGITDGPQVDAILRHLLAPDRLAGVDTLVLGCTHYPFLVAAIRRVVGPEVALVDSGAAIARRTRDLLTGRTRDDPHLLGSLRLLTSGDPERVGVVARRLLGEAAVGPARHLAL